MDKLIELINKKIEELEEEMYDLSDLMEEELAKARLLHSVENNPDSIDAETFKPLFSSDLSSTIDDILTFKGWFSSSSNESQIISARAKLDDLIKTKMKEYEDKYVSIREKEIIPKDKIAKQYKETLAILTSYNNEKYITPEELEQIDRLVKLIGNPDEAVNFYLEIAINNIKNANRVKTTETPVEEMEEELSDTYNATLDGLNTTAEIIEDEKTERDIVIERLTKFLNVERKEKPSYLDMKKKMGPKLYSITKKIILAIKDVMDRKDKRHPDRPAVDFNALKEYLEELGLDITLEKNYFDAGILSEMLDGYETKDVEKIRSVIQKYRKKIAFEEQRAQAKAEEEARLLRELEAEEEQARAERARRAAEEEAFEQDFNQALIEEQQQEQEETDSLDDYKPLPGLEEYAKILKDINEKYKISDFIKENKNHLSSLDELTTDEIKETFTFEEDYYKYCIADCYAKMVKILLKKSDDPEDISTLEELKTQLAAAINNYDEYINSRRTTLDELRDSGEPFNYIVIFDQEEFDRTYKEERDTSPIAKAKYPAEVLGCMTNLINETNMAEAKHKFHNIHRAKGTPNNDEICDYPCRSQCRMRLTVKVLENPHVVVDKDGEKHNVIIIFHNVYARKEKSEELMDTLTLFDRNQERFKELQRIFGPNGTKEEQEREFARAFSIVDGLKMKVKTL